ncbi:MAG: hypothetical protein D6719_01135 [Candidatus Dadabacteria bacterium]|nr:MAG: hypothetical protein D6719_01135 [Candidatus Dadabacteria bacterium]
MTLQTSGGTDNSGAAMWEKAKNYAKEIGYVPGSFSIAARTLMADEFKFGGNIRPVTKFQVARLFRTPSFKSMLYYSVKSIFPDRLEGKERVSVGDMMDAYSPFDLAVLILSFVLYRKARRMMADEWPRFQEGLDDDSQIGCQIGTFIPAIGTGTALLACSMRHYALAAMSKENLKQYKVYRRKLKETGEHYNFQLEHELWGCSSMHVGVIILTNFGFGAEVAQAYSSGVDPNSSFHHIKDPLSRRMKIANLWIEGINKGLDQPISNIPGEFYPDKAIRDALYARIEKIHEGEKNWLDYTKDDISPEKTPQLFAKVQQEGEYEVPEELEDVFSLEDITSMEEEDFDQLIDQIDAEAEGTAPKGSTILSSSDIDELEDIVE